MESKSKQADPHIILDDGYTVTRYIAGIERLYGAVRVTFRPASAEQLEAFRMKLSSDDGVGNAKKIAEATAMRIVSWNVRDRDGKPAEVSAKVVRSLQTRLQARFVSVVLWGADGGDVDPEEGESELNGVNDGGDIASIFSPPATEELEANRGN